MTFWVNSGILYYARPQKSINSIYFPDGSNETATLKGRLPTKE